MNNRILHECACKTGVSNVKRQQGIDGDQSAARFFPFSQRWFKYLENKTDEPRLQLSNDCRVFSYAHKCKIHIYMILTCFQQYLSCSCSWHFNSLILAAVLPTVWYIMIFQVVLALLLGDDCLSILEPEV